MNFTLFGYPQTGKTTLFNLLTGANIEVKGYGDGKTDPHVRTCPVPDQRFEGICALYPEKKKKPAVVDYIDLAGASFGEIKHEAYLNYLRRADGLAHVVRGFQDDRIPHIKAKVSPQDDIRSMEEEILLTDLMSVESRLEKLEKELKKSKNVEGEKEKDLLLRIHTALEAGNNIREMELNAAEYKVTRSFAFLSQKPLFHLVNVDENEISLISVPEKLYPFSKKETAVMGFCGKIEMEILELEDAEKALFLEEYGIKELSAARFLKTSYDLLGVITFFTVGKEEVKAWTLRKGTSALNAAGLIHSDIEKGFIRAEVTPWEELIKYSSYQAAKEQAAVRLEGKDYIVQDGDVILFRFNK